MEAVFNPAIHNDNPPLDAAFLGGMKPSRRGCAKLEAPKVKVKIRLDGKTVEYLRSLPNLRCDVDWENDRSKKPGKARSAVETVLVHKRRAWRWCV